MSFQRTLSRLKDSAFWKPIAEFKAKSQEDFIEFSTKVNAGQREDIRQICRYLDCSFKCSGHGTEKRITVLRRQNWDEWQDPAKPRWEPEKPTPEQASDLAERLGEVQAQHGGGERRVLRNARRAGLLERKAKLLAALTAEPEAAEPGQVCPSCGAACAWMSPVGGEDGGMVSWATCTVGCTCLPEPKKPLLGKLTEAEAKAFVEHALGRPFPLLEAPPPPEPEPAAPEPEPEAPRPPEGFLGALEAAKTARELTAEQELKQALARRRSTSSSSSSSSSSSTDSSEQRRRRKRNRQKHREKQAQKDQRKADAAAFAKRAAEARGEAAAPEPELKLTPEAQQKLQELQKREAELKAKLAAVNQKAQDKERPREEAQRKLQQLADKEQVLLKDLEALDKLPRLDADQRRKREDLVLQQQQLSLQQEDLVAEFGLEPPAKRRRPMTWQERKEQEKKDREAQVDRGSRWSPSRDFAAERDDQARRAHSELYGADREQAREQLRDQPRKDREPRRKAGPTTVRSKVPLHLLRSRSR